MDVGIRELRAGLSRYVERVKRGEEIVVTERGRPVARLVPMNGERKIDRLIREGTLIPAAPAEGSASSARRRRRRDAQRHRHRAATLSTYFDSSAFVKLLLVEPGSRAVGAAWDDAGPASPRPRSTRNLGRRSRRPIAATESTKLSISRRVEELDGLWPEIDVLELTEPLARRAGALAEAHALRGYDAIHLASAEAVLDAGSVMVVADAQLAEAATAIGLEALVPGPS